MNRFDPLTKDFNYAQLRELMYLPLLQPTVSSLIGTAVNVVMVLATSLTGIVVENATILSQWDYFFHEYLLKFHFIVMNNILPLMLVEYVKNYNKIKLESYKNI